MNRKTTFDTMDMRILQAIDFAIATDKMVTAHSLKGRIAKWLRRISWQRTPPPE